MACKPTFADVEVAAGHLSVTDKAVQTITSIAPTEIWPLHVFLDNTVSSEKLILSIYVTCSHKTSTIVPQLWLDDDNLLLDESRAVKLSCTWVPK